MTVDWYFDALNEGLKPVVPHIFQIPRGKASSSSPPVVFNWSCPAEVPVPEPLIPVHHQRGWFSLQPVRALPLDGALRFLQYNLEWALSFHPEYNNALNGFYSKYAEKTLVEKWLEEHDYNSGDADDDPSTWH